MAEQKQGCTGDCRACTVIQRGYCASQLAYNNMGLISTLTGMIKAAQDEIKALAARLDAIQDGELKEPKKAQKGDGAENRSPKQVKD